MVDLRSNVNIPTELIAQLGANSGPGPSITNGLNNFLQGQQEGQQAAEMLRKKRLIQQLAQQIQMQGAPMQGPQLPGANMAPNGMKPTSGMGAPSPDLSGSISSLIMQLNPESAIQSYMDQQDPLKKSQIALNQAHADNYRRGNGKLQGSYWVNPNDPTDISPIAKDGYIQYTTSQADAGSKVTGAAQSKAKTAAVAGRVEAWNRSIDVRQVNELTKRVSLTPRMQSLLQQNNGRAARAVEILSKPNITWQELALGEIDLAGIMQGGVPHVDEVKATHFPGWSESWAQFKTKATQTPQEQVPPAIKNKVLSLVRGVVDIDNKFLTANAKFNKQTLIPTIRGGQQLTPSIDEMTDAITQGGKGGSSSSKGKDPLGLNL